MLNLERSSSLVSTHLRFSIASARLHANKGECSDAIINYLAVLRSLPPDGRKRFTGEFLTALQAYLKTERNKNKVKEVLNASSTLYEFEFNIWRVWAEWLFSQGEFLRSLELFKRAMGNARNDIEWLHAAVSVENVKSNLMDAWHWRMINDGKRNKAFQQALQLAIERMDGNAKVLDIGCGTGIFSILASKQGCEVYACDCDAVMCQVAQDCFEKNEVHVGLSRCHSSNLLLPPGTLCDILVTETVDCAIFGERIVQTVLDAREKLLTKNADAPNIVIPRKATAIFSLIESTDIAQENYYESGEDYALISQTSYVNTTSSCSDNLPRQPYTCAYLSQLPNGYRLISEPSEGLAVNFDNSAQLKLFNSNKFTTDIVLEAIKKGVAHAVVCWFRLNLFEDIELCSSPDDDLCWQQAIFPFYPPKSLQPGDKLRFEVFLRDHKLYCVPVESHDTQQASSSLLPFRQILRAPVDVDFLAMQNQTIRNFFWQSLKDGDFGSALDCTDLLIAEGFDDEMLDEKLDCGGVEPEEDEKPELLPSKNVVKMEVASNKPAIRYVSDKAMNLSTASCCPTTNGQPSAILFWPISSKGLLMDDYLASIIEVHIRSPSHQTRLIPSLIQLKACLISSTQLLNRSRLAATEGLGYEMASFPVESPHCGLDLSPINQFKLQYFHEIETVNLDYECLSESVDIFQMCFEEVEKELEQLTKIRNDLEIEVNSSGECHAILYWFEFADSQLESANRLSMLGDVAGKASAYIVNESRFVQPGEKLKLQASLHHGTVIFHGVEFVNCL